MLRHYLFLLVAYGFEFARATDTPDSVNATNPCTSGNSSICPALCFELQQSHLLPSLNLTQCLSQCEQASRQISGRCQESLCEWALGSTPLALLSAQDEMKLLEAYYTSSKTLAAVVLSMKSLLSLVQGNTKGWTSIQRGHLKNVGQYDACRDISGAHYCSSKITISERAGFGPFALCVPQSCTPENVNTIYEFTQYFVARAIVNITKAVAPSVPIEPKSLVLPVTTTCGDKSYPLDASAATTIAVVCILAGIVLFVTIFLYLRPYCTRDQQSQGYQPVSDNGVHAVQIPDKAADAQWQDRHHDESRLSHNGIRAPEALGSQMMDKASEVGAVKSQGADPTKSSPKALGERVLDALSLRHAYNNFFQLRKSTGTEAMDGVRVFSMMWVIFGHTILWPLLATQAGYSNIMALVPFEGQRNALLATWAGQVIPSAEFSVDTFFFMSGFLALFVSLRKLRGKQAFDAVKTAPILYLHRWLRITPVYMLILWFYTTVIPVTMSGPFFNMSREIQTCKENWFYNLLYVQTVFPNHPERSVCYGVSWYLADDMIFFWATPFLLAIFLWNKIAGVLFPLLLTTGSITAAWIVAWKWRLRVPTFDGSQYNSFYYNPPWMRAPAYLLGCVMGMAYYEWKRRKLTVPKEYRLYIQGFVGGFAAILLGSTVYGFRGGNTNVPSTVSEADNNAYLALSKPAWCIGVGCMLWLCFEGMGGPVEWFLSRPLFGYISKLTFLMYLLHPIVLAIRYFPGIMPIHFTISNFAFDFIAVLFTTLTLSFVVHLIIEAPLASLEVILMSHLLPKKTKARVAAVGPVSKEYKRRDDYKDIGTSTEEGKAEYYS